MEMDLPKIRRHSKIPNSMLRQYKITCDTESNDLPEEPLDEHMIKNDGQQNFSLESQHSVGSWDLDADRPPMQVLTEETRKQFHPSETFETDEYKKPFTAAYSIN